MVTEEKDEELTLFLELRRREKDKDRNNFLHLPINPDAVLSNNTTSAAATLGSGPGASPTAFKMMSFPTHRKTAADRFLDSENDKSDYDWLLTPPGTPLFPSLEMESQKTAMSQNGMSNARPNARPTALKTRLTNIQEEPALRTNITSKDSYLTTGLKSSSTATRRPSSSAGIRSSSRPATPTGRPSLPTAAKPSRSSTPTSRATLSSTKPAAPQSRSSTPSRATARSSTPTPRPSAPLSKSTPRSATPTRLPSTSSSAPGASPHGRSSSVSKSIPTASKNPAPSRGSSPTVKSRPWKPNEMPGFSLDAPPNLRTSLPERPASASRGRPGFASARSSSIDAGPNGKPRQQSCSPSRGRASNGNLHGSRATIPAKSRVQTNSSDDVNPVLMGTKLVERVVNMRKLAPPRQEDHSSARSSAGKFSSLDSTGFGRTLSKKSLDMALRHMDIRRSVQGNLRPLVTNIPASSMYSVRSGGSGRSRTISVSDSPLATSSNASSEPSVNNNSFFVDGVDIGDNDFGSERGIYPACQLGR